MTSFRGVTLSR